jgi:hypothetical protein
MGIMLLCSAVRNRIATLMRSRAIKSVLFSGAPVLERIRMDGSPVGPVFTLFYKNGLMLTLGESGILDYQDRGFDGFMGGESRATRDHEFLASLHRIVLHSLLRYITAPRVDVRQRERAAEAASKLYLACERPSGSPAAPDNVSWSPGSPRESARSR